MLKETEIIKQPLYIAKLENGVTILVYDGYAKGSDGKTYHYVDRQIGDDEFEGVGWRCEEE